MALIPPFFLDCVVAIGFPGADGTRWAATGFIYGSFLDRIDDQRARYRTFLVTNRHVLKDEPTVIVRFNPEAAEPAREYRVAIVNDQGQPLWTPHPDETIDVAVLPINYDDLVAQGVRVAMFRGDLDPLFREQAMDVGLTEGDGVFVLGFPMGLVGGARNYVIVRQGVIARIRDWLSGGANEFLVDASIFPGNSGGPVVNFPEVLSITGTKPAINTAHLLGVVAGFLSYTDVAISAQTKRPRVTFEENSGLASIVPIDFVREAIEAFVATHPLASPSPPGEVTEAPTDESDSLPPTP